MKKLFFFLASAFVLAASCSPQVYPVYLEVRQPSASGLDLARKTMSIVYMERQDTAFSRATASALARCLEKDYFGGEEAVSLYHVPAVDTISLEEMRSLVMTTDRDVVFLLSAEKGATPVREQIPVSSVLRIYDSLGEDAVHSYKGTALFSPSLASPVDSLSSEVARRISTRFLPQWKRESFSFYYYDTLDGQWSEALDLLYVGRLSKAIDKWLPLAQKGENIRRAAAGYNLAMAFYLLEDYALATRWLDYADSLENLTLSPGLHKRLEASH